MSDYQIKLKNEKLNQYNRLSKLIILIFFIIFCYLAVFSGIRYIKIASIGVAGLLAVGFGLQFYFRNTKYQIGHRPFFLIITFGWISIENYWMAGAALLFELFSSITSRKMDVYVTKQNIQYPSVPAKNIKWIELNQVILKDGLLTIDFKSNKLIQQMIDEIKTSVNEKEFNDFCRQQLNK